MDGRIRRALQVCSLRLRVASTEQHGRWLETNRWTQAELPTPPPQARDILDTEPLISSLMPITAVCSAGQHSGEKKSSTSITILVPYQFFSPGRDSGDPDWTWLSPFCEVPPFTRSTTRLHGQLFTSACQSRWRTKTSIVTWIPVSEGSSVHFTPVTLSSYRRTLTSITPSYATTCWSLYV